MYLIDDVALLTGAAAIIFAGGRLVNKMENNRYVKRETCAFISSEQNRKFEVMQKDVSAIREHLMGKIK